MVGLGCTIIKITIVFIVFIVPEHTHRKKLLGGVKLRENLRVFQLDSPTRRKLPQDLLLHEGSRCHKDALLKMVTLPATTCAVGESLQSST